MRTDFAHRTKTRLELTVVAWCVSALAASASAQSGQTLLHTPDISFRHEVEHAIDQGVLWLQSNQTTNGWWSTPDQPAITALALSAMMDEPSGAMRAVPPSVLARGYKFVTDSAKPDGSLSGKGLANFNTSICMLGLMAARNPQFDPLLRKARVWLIRQQVEAGTNVTNSENRLNLSDTMAVSEALYYSKRLETPGDESSAAEKALDRAATVRFIESCQNQGGFVDEPSESKAGTVTNSDGRQTLRSYGSATCEGLLSYKYAGVNRDDPRVIAAYDWLRDNFSVDENPGAGRQGLYGYLHLMAKALSIYGVDQLPLKSGQTADWRREIAIKLNNSQNGDGSWSNEKGHWWEDDPVVATAYSVISLEILYSGL